MCGMYMCVRACVYVCVYSNVTTWQMHNALLLMRLALKHFLENLSEMEAILQLDGAKTVQQITSLEGGATPTSLSAGSAHGGDMKPDSDGIRGSQTASGGVSGVKESELSNQAVAAVSSSDLDSLASKAAGVATERCVCMCVVM